MSVTTTNFAYALKTLYPQSRVLDEAYKDHALLAMVPKDKEFYGANMARAVRYANPQGRSATFSTAQTNVGNNKGVQFLLKTQRDDGAWLVETRSKPVQVFFDNGDPGDKSQFISMTATGWAVWALLKSLPDQR